MAEKFNGVGEIVSWEVPAGFKIEAEVLRKAMSDAGLNSKMARDVCASNAFRRATHEMKENRVIRKVKDENGFLYFQFTSEHLKGGEYEYSKECVLRINKDSGVVSGQNPGLVSLAQNLVDEKIRFRYKTDITNILKRLFRDHGDLFPICSNGGAYFVPQQHVGLCSQIQQMLQSIGAKLRQWEQADSPCNSANAAEAIFDHIKEMVQEYSELIADMDISNDKSIAKTTLKLSAVKMKMSFYQDTLCEYADDIDGLLLDATREFGDKLTGIQSDVKDVGPEPTEPTEPVTERAPEPAPVTEPAPDWMSQLA